MHLAIRRSTVRSNIRPAVFWLTVVALGSTLIDRSPPMVFTGGEVIPSKVRATERIQLIRYGSIDRHCNGITFREIRDAKGYVWILDSTPSLAGSLIVRPGEQQELAGRAFGLPDGIAEGKARFRSSIHFTCKWFGFDNPVQRVWPIVVTLPEVEFEVVR